MPSEEYLRGAVEGLPNPFSAKPPTEVAPGRRLANRQDGLKRDAVRLAEICGMDPVTFAERAQELWSSMHPAIQARMVISPGNHEMQLFLKGFGLESVPNGVRLFSTFVGLCQQSAESGMSIEEILGGLQ